MKYLGILILVVALGACCRDDCDNSMYLAFRVVDATGKDLVLTLNVPVDSIRIRTSQGTYLNLYQVFADPAYLAAGLPSSEDEFILSYDHRQTTINVTSKVVDKDRCCGEKYGVENVEASSGSVSTELTPDRKQTVYIIRL